MNATEKEISKESEYKVIKVSYLWKSNERFFSRNRIIRTTDKNINIPILNTYDGVREILLQPRHIGLNPFTDDDSLLIMSDMFDSKGNRLASDKRNDLVKLLNSKKVLEEKNARFSFSIKVNILDQNKYVVLQNIAEEKGR